jgi:hypothetical protein
MEAIVKGVKITLTAEQIKQIEAHQSKQKQECSTFTKTLKHFGFRKMSTKGWANPDANCWTTEHWIVEIFNSGNHNEYCSVAGSGVDLSSSGWPITISSPQELVEILNKALEEIANGIE